MFHVTLHGSRYALLGETVSYDIDSIELPPNTDPTNLVITWWKNGQEMKRYPWEEPDKLFLYDVGYPAEGDYYATLEIDGYHARTNTIHLEIGTERRQVTVNVNSRTVIEAAIGESIDLHPSCQVQPPYAHYEMYWTKGTETTPLGPDEFITVHVNSEADFGNYVLHTEAMAHGGFIPAHAQNLLRIVPYGSIEGQCPNIYVHDLIPGRDKGYIRVGWWVINEIFEANKNGIHWETDPFDPRLKYHCEIANLVHALTKWPDIEVQESRHGYVLSHADLHRTDVNYHKGLGKYGIRKKGLN